MGWVWPEVQAPFAQGAEAVAVALDGEVHNWADLADGAGSPAEALQKAYLSEGPRFVARMDGPFALAIAGPRGLFLARDLVGKSPLYYGISRHAVCFASEVKALLGWADHISEFPPGHVHDPALGLASFASLEQPAMLDYPPEAIAPRLREHLTASVRKRMRQGEVGTWLSGGLDSATMTALARQQVPNLRTFSVGMQGAPDLQHARAVADYLETEHFERVVTVDEMLSVLPEVIYSLESFDALLVRSSIMNYLVGRLAAEHVPAVLSGEGGDELFAGYSYLKYLHPDDLPEELVDITKRLHNTALQRVDRCSAAHGLVARTGFLDRDVLDFAMRIPPGMKIRENGASVEKWILRVAMDGLLPEEILWRPKSKFWEGAGVGELLAAHADQAIPDTEFLRERRLPNGASLNTKEELFYFRIFREQFGDMFDVGLVGRTKGAPRS
jgi:asparagine synthase (glutamine-hydrolysing)